jgi:hypothetical protein
VGDGAAAGVPDTLSPGDVRSLRLEPCCGVVSFEGGPWRVMGFSFEGTVYVRRAFLRWPLRFLLPVVLDHERAHGRLWLAGVPWEWHHDAMRELR